MTSAVKARSCAELFDERTRTASRTAGVGAAAVGAAAAGAGAAQLSGVLRRQVGAQPLLAAHAGTLVLHNNWKHIGDCQQISELA